MPDLVVSSLKVTQLKSELAARRLPTSGLKAVLVQRLQDAIDAELNSESNSKTPALSPPTLTPSQASSDPPTQHSIDSQIPLPSQSPQSSSPNHRKRKQAPLVTKEADLPIKQARTPSSLHPQPNSLQDSSTSLEPGFNINPESDKPVSSTIISAIPLTHPTSTLTPTPSIQLIQQPITSNSILSSETQSPSAQPTETNCPSDANDLHIPISQPPSQHEDQKTPLLKPSSPVHSQLASVDVLSSVKPSDGPSQSPLSPPPDIQAQKVELDTSTAISPAKSSSARTNPPGPAGSQTTVESAQVPSLPAATPLIDELQSSKSTDPDADVPQHEVHVISPIQNPQFTAPSPENRSPAHLPTVVREDVAHVSVSEPVPNGDHQAEKNAENGSRLDETLNPNDSQVPDVSSHPANPLAVENVTGVSTSQAASKTSKLIPSPEPKLPENLPGKRPEVTDSVTATSTELSRNHSRTSPAQKSSSEPPLSRSLYIANLVRPLTIPQIKAMLSEFGTIEFFWIDAIRSHAYVTFAEQDSAIAAYRALHQNTPWPPRTGKSLALIYLPTDRVSDLTIQEDEARTRGAGRLELICSPPSRDDDGWTYTLSPFNGLRVSVSTPRGLASSIPTSLSIASPTLNRIEPRQRVPTASRESERLEPMKPEENPKGGADRWFKKTKTRPCLYWAPVSS